MRPRSARAPGPATSEVRKCRPAQMRASMSSASGCENVSKRAHPHFSRRQEAGRARDLEAPCGLVAEEHPQHGDVCAVEAVVSRGPLGIRRGDERRPARVSVRRGVVVLCRSWDGVPRPPEVEVVLVVPAVDRRVRSGQVLQRQEPRAVGGVEVVPCDELAGDLVPAQDATPIDLDATRGSGRNQPRSGRSARLARGSGGWWVVLLLRELLLDLLVDLVLAALPSAPDHDQAHDPRPDERHHQADEDRQCPVGRGRCRRSRR